MVRARADQRARTTRQQLSVTELAFAFLLTAQRAKVHQCLYVDDEIGIVESDSAQQFCDTVEAAVTATVIGQPRLGLLVSSVVTVSAPSHTRN